MALVTFASNPTPSQVDLDANFALLGAKLSGFILLNAEPGADPTGVTDSASAINTALATGQDVYGFGTFKIGSTLTMSTTQGQRLMIRGALKPTFRGDTVRLVAFNQKVDVPIDGLLQAATGTTGAALVVGYAGANAQQASVARSRVINYTGDGLRWDQGSMLDMTGLHIQSVSGDGILCTGAYDDNNHGQFTDTHVIAAAGIGYNIKGANSGTFYDANASRSHVFSNAKAFGCGRNFLINSTGNVGSVFSELGTLPDQFGALSAGNDIQVIETMTAYSLWQNLGGTNTLTGYSSYHNTESTDRVFGRYIVNKRAAGRLITEQTAALTFRDTIDSTTGADSVTMTHARGTAGKRTDIFEDRVQLPGALVISGSTTGTLTPTVGALAAGATTTVTVAAGTANAAAGDTALATIALGAATAPLNVSAQIETGGGLTITITNRGASSVTPGAVTIRWIVMKHVA